MKNIINVAVIPVVALGESFEFPLKRFFRFYPKSNLSSDGVLVADIVSSNLGYAIGKFDVAITLTVIARDGRRD